MYRKYLKKTNKIYIFFWSFARIPIENKIYHENIKLENPRSKSINTNNIKKTERARFLFSNLKKFFYYFFIYFILCTHHNTVLLAALFICLNKLLKIWYLFDLKILFKKKILLIEKRLNRLKIKDFVHSLFCKYYVSINS